MKTGLPKQTIKTWESQAAAQGGLDILMGGRRMFVANLDDWIFIILDMRVTADTHGRQAVMAPILGLLVFYSLLS